MRIGEITVVSPIASGTCWANSFHAPPSGDEEAWPLVMGQGCAREAHAG